MTTPWKPAKGCNARVAEIGHTKLYQLTRIVPILARAATFTRQKSYGRKKHRIYQAKKPHGARFAAAARFHQPRFLKGKTMRNFIPVNQGLNFYDCPGIESWLVKQTLAKYNYRCTFTVDNTEKIVYVHTVNDSGLKPLEKIYEYLTVILLLVADLKQLTEKTYI